MPEQNSEEEVRPWEPPVAVAPRLLHLTRGVRARPEVPRRLGTQATQMNWRAGYLLSLGTAIGYCMAAWLDAVASGL